MVYIIERAQLESATAHNNRIQERRNDFRMDNVQIRMSERYAQAPIYIISGIVLGIIGSTLLYQINKRKKNNTPPSTGNIRNHHQTG